MIARIRGILLERQPPRAIVEAGGIGYELYLPIPAFYQLKPVGSEVILFTHVVIREDAHQLYGFTRSMDRMVFQELLRVSGIGAKTALAMLSGMTTEDLLRSLAQRDHARLCAVPGIGKKTAERLLLEMQDKIASLIAEADRYISIDTAAEANSEQTMSPQLAPHPLQEQSSAHPPGNDLWSSDPIHEAVSALVHLGYRQNDAERHVARVKGQANRVEDLILLALKAIK